MSKFSENKADYFIYLLKKSEPGIIHLNISTVCPFRISIINYILRTVLVHCILKKNNNKKNNNKKNTPPSKE